MTTIIDSICPECGIIKKSGKMSCCGRGGSWFGNCGSVGNANFDHTWHGGITVCKARQFGTALIQKLLPINQMLDLSPNRTFTSPRYPKARPLVNGTMSKLIHVAPADISLSTSIRTSASASITAPGCEKSMRAVTHISMIFIVICSFE